jgi:two-component system sensor histidine kinase SenX3
LQENEENEEKLDVAAAFAMVSHDIKNSLGVLLKDVGVIMENCDVASCGMRPRCAEMEYESRRINNNLVKMLTLFKVEEGSYVLNVDAHSVQDFLEETMLEQGSIMREKGIEFEIECSGDLYWYFDRNLMTGVMGNAISNALRYTKDKLRASARATEEGLEISVEDNGSGFPTSMLADQDDLARPATGFLNNNTGLGLYFTQVVLDLHRHDERRGRVELSNEAALGGGRLSLLLP